MIFLKEEFFPDGTKIDPWFYDTTLPSAGKKYVLEAKPDELCTEKIQALIDTAHSRGGGTVVIPEGTYYSGALFFKDGVNLFIEKGGVLKGSFNISDYPLVKTRIAGLPFSAKELSTGTARTPGARSGFGKSGTRTARIRTSSARGSYISTIRRKSPSAA